MLATFVTSDPSKGYRALRQGRHSLSGMEYFVTFCTDRRQTVLASEVVAPVILSEIQRMEAEGIWEMRCAVVMPDHVHLLFQLGTILTLGRAIARLKSKSLVGLKACGGSHWQAGYFEHRVRPEENPLPLFLYIHLNPYKAGLLPVTSVWPWYHCRKEDLDWFSGYLDQGLPEPAWLNALP